MALWKPFTERARRSIVLAQEEAQRLGNNYIGTEHILLGIISEGESLAAKVLETLGVDAAKARRAVEAIAGRGRWTVQQEMVFTPRAKRVVERAFDEARRLDHDHIGPEHLLMGLVREGDGIAVWALMNLGVDRAEVLAKTTSLLGDRQPHKVTALGEDFFPTDRIERVVPMFSHQDVACGVLRETFCHCAHSAEQRSDQHGFAKLAIWLREFRHLAHELDLTVFSIALPVLLWLEIAHQVGR
jgi:ATP-dependent Clp protease ATP-binding subunit ClpA